MLHNFEGNALKFQLARQARVSSVVLKILSVLALVVVLTQLLSFFPI